MHQSFLMMLISLFFLKFTYITFVGEFSVVGFGWYIWISVFVLWFMSLKLCTLESLDSIEAKTLLILLFLYILRLIDEEAFSVVIVVAIAVAALAPVFSSTNELSFVSGFPTSLT